MIFFTVPRLPPRCIPAEGRSRYRFSRALCSFALRDEPAFRKPLRVIKSVCVACRYSFSPFEDPFFFFVLCSFFPSRWLLPVLILADFACAALRPSFTSLSPNEQRRATSRRRYWLSGHAKARLDSLIAKFLLAADSRRQFSSSRLGGDLGGEKFRSTKRDAT